MSQTLSAPSPAAPGCRLLSELEDPRQVFANITPNWFAPIMGTGIVANAAAALPLQFPGLRIGATIVWGLASILLITLTAATIAHWVTNRAQAKSAVAYWKFEPDSLACRKRTFADLVLERRRTVRWQC